MQINILLADDDEDDRLFFSMALSKISMPTTLATVEDGESLMDYLTKGQCIIPDVLFLDVNMPRKNGLECLVEIKANERVKDLPVVIYSTFMNSAVSDVFYQKGAHYFLRKCNLSELIVYLHYTLINLTNNNFKRETQDKFIVSLPRSTT